MPTLSFLTKTAAVAAAVFCAATTASAAEENFFRQQVEGLTNTWNHAHDIIQEGLKEWLPKFPIHHDNDDFIKTFSHPAFPEYSMRYKTPSLCDPNVKQVKDMLDWLKKNRSTQ